MRLLNPANLLLGGNLPSMFTLWMSTSHRMSLWQYEYVPEAVLDTTIGESLVAVKTEKNNSLELEVTKILRIIQTSMLNLSICFIPTPNLRRAVSSASCPAKSTSIGFVEHRHFTTRLAPATL